MGDIERIAKLLRDPAIEKQIAAAIVLGELKAKGPEVTDGLDKLLASHVPPVVRRRLHAACVRGLVPGGVLLLEAYTPDQIARGTGGPRDAALTMTLEALREELAGLEIVVGRERVRDVHEGTFHEGASAVVQLLAKKPA